ncbi:hypothetical protein Q1695_003375 [Nippostrongylus brasiliensis]|nr:hypothetical protein Q1695_003375 [Nippostrongylus brasiliensis]
MHLLVILCLNFAVSSAQIDGERTTIFSQDQTSTNKEPQTTMIATEPGDEYYDDDESTGTQTSAVPEDEATEESPEGTSTEEKSDTTVTTDEGMISTTLLPETMEENAGAETENATGMEGTLSTTALSEATETTNPQVTKALEDEGEETTATDEGTVGTTSADATGITTGRTTEEAETASTAGQTGTTTAIGPTFVTITTTTTQSSTPSLTSTATTAPCVDRINPSTGRSDCPRRRNLCFMPSYIRLMRQQCPRTCGFCSNRRRPVESDAEKLMKELCPLTCGFCSPNVKSASTELEDCADSRVSTACNLRRMVCRHSNTPLTIRRQMEAQCAVTCGVCSKMR